MAIGSPFTNVGFHLRRAGTVESGDVGLFLGLGLYFFFFWRASQFGSFEGNSRGHRLGDFFVRYVSSVRHNARFL